VRLSLVLLAVLLLPGCPGTETQRFTFEVHSDLCIDKQNDGACTDSWFVIGTGGGTYSDYLNQQRYAGLVVVTMGDGGQLVVPTPGVTVTGTSEVDGGVDYSLGVAADTQQLGVMSQKAHLQTDGGWAIGGLTGTREAWLEIDHEYTKERFDPTAITRVEVRYGVLYQVNVPLNDAHNDDQPYVYTGGAVWTGGELPALDQGSANFNTDPLMLTKQLDGAGQPITGFTTLDLVFGR
jgi:hypothetical protein